MKPVSGGSPPRDRRIKGRRAVITGAFAQDKASVLMVVVLFSLNIRNAANVIVK